MNAIERVISVLNHKPPDRLPQCNFFSEGFVRKNSSPDKNLYVEFGYDIVPFFANIAPMMTPSVMEKEKDGTFTDGWGRKCRHLLDSDYIEVLKHAPFSIETLDRYAWDPVELPERYEKPSPGNLHHPRPFAEELRELKGKAFLCGNVYDPFETLGRVIGIKNALITLNTNPDEIKIVLKNFGNYMKELGLAQLNYTGYQDLQGIWIWGDIAYNRGLMFSPTTYHELILPPLKEMCSAFSEQGVKIIYHTDGNPREVLTDLIEAGIHALHPTEQVPGMELESLLTEYAGKITFIGGIPPIKSKTDDPVKELEPTLSKILELGANGGLIPGFTNFIHTDLDPDILRTITKYFVENDYKQ